MNRWGRAALEVVALHGLLGWCYVAAYAAVYPDALSRPIAAVLPLRRDTFGELAFAASAAAVILLLGTRTAPVRTRRPDLARHGWAVAVLRTVCGYGLAAWVYLCVNSLTHPWTTGKQLTHLAPWPSEGQTAVAGFAASALAFFLLRAGRPGDRAEGGSGG
jgi:hypothetical protein